MLKANPSSSDAVTCVTLVTLGFLTAMKEMKVMDRITKKNARPELQWSSCKDKTCEGKRQNVSRESRKEVKILAMLLSLEMLFRPYQTHQCWG